MERVKVVIRCRPLSTSRDTVHHTLQEESHQISSRNTILSNTYCSPSLWSLGSTPGSLRVSPNIVRSDGTVEPINFRYSFMDVREFNFDSIVGILSSAQPSTQQHINDNHIITSLNDQEKFYEAVCLPSVRKAIGVQTCYDGKDVLRSPPVGFVNATFFAYGQTGSGKTYTIDGTGTQAQNHREKQIKKRRKKKIPSLDDEHKEVTKKINGDDAGNSNSDFSAGDGDSDGIIQVGRPDIGLVSRAIRTIFDSLEERRQLHLKINTSSGDIVPNTHPDGDDPLHNSENNSKSPYRNSHQNATHQDTVVDYQIDVSFLEIYNECLHDLLNPLTESACLRLRTSANNTEKMMNHNNSRTTSEGKKFHVENLSRFRCANTAEALTHYRSGVNNKVFRSHAMNKRSSRSHSIFTLFISCTRMLPVPYDENGIQKKTKCKNGEKNGMEKNEIVENSKDDFSSFEDVLLSTYTDHSEDEEYRSLNASIHDRQNGSHRYKKVTDVCEINFVDLAGSERLDKIVTNNYNFDNNVSLFTKGHGKGLNARSILTNESKYINTSLLALGKVIQVLSDRSGRRTVKKAQIPLRTSSNPQVRGGRYGSLGGPSRHSSSKVTSSSPHTSGVDKVSFEVIPFRDSKLTTILNHSFGGNCLTTLIACIRQEGEFLQESLSTLLFASRAKNITNLTVPNCNTVTHDSNMLTVKIEQFRKQNEKLKRYKIDMKMLDRELMEANRAILSLKEELKVAGNSRNAIGNDFIECDKCGHQIRTGSNVKIMPINITDRNKSEKICSTKFANEDRLISNGNKKSNEDHNTIIDQLSEELRLISQKYKKSLAENDRLHHQGIEMQRQNMHLIAAQNHLEEALLESKASVDIYERLLMYAPNILSGESHQYQQRTSKNQNGVVVNGPSDDYLSNCAEYSAVIRDPKEDEIKSSQLFQNNLNEVCKCQNDIFPVSGDITKIITPVENQPITQIIENNNVMTNNHHIVIPRDDAETRELQRLNRNMILGISSKQYDQHLYNKSFRTRKAKIASKAPQKLMESSSSCVSDPAVFSSHLPISPDIEGTSDFNGYFPSTYASLGEMDLDSSSAEVLGPTHCDNTTAPKSAGCIYDTLALLTGSCELDCRDDSMPSSITIPSAPKRTIQMITRSATTLANSDKRKRIPVRQSAYTHTV